MTYEEFVDIKNQTDREEGYYRWVCHLFYAHHSKEDEENYEYYRKKWNRINDFMTKVLTEALKDIPKDYFD